MQIGTNTNPPTALRISSLPQTVHSDVNTWPPYLRKDEDRLSIPAALRIFRKPVAMTTISFGGLSNNKLGLTDSGAQNVYMRPDILCKGLLGENLAFIRPFFVDLSDFFLNASRLVIEDQISILSGSMEMDFCWLTDIVAYFQKIFYILP